MVCAMSEISERVTVDGVEVEVIYSTRRMKSVSGRWHGSTFQMRVPSYFEPIDVERYAHHFLERSARASKKGSDEFLEQRAHELNQKYLEGKASFRNIRWVENQSRRWGSTTPGTGTIRINDSLKLVPDYVLDSVLIHELSHLIAPNGHDAEFWSWAGRAPKLERAQGYLEAYSQFGPNQERS